MLVVNVLLLLISLPSDPLTAPCSCLPPAVTPQESLYGGVTTTFLCETPTLFT